MRRSGAGIPTFARTSIASRRASAVDTPRWRTAGSMLWTPTVKTAFSDVIGSWKIMPMSLPRLWRMRRSRPFARSSPSNRISPPLGEQVEDRDDEEDREAGSQDQHPVLLRPALREQVAPRGGARVAEAQERERGLDQDRSGDAERGRDEHGPDAVGQHVAED